MKNETKIIICTFFVMFLIFISSFIYINKQQNYIKNDYIAVFKGEENDDIHLTYVYIKKRKKGKIKYKYINSLISVDKYESTSSLEKIIDFDDVDSRKKLFMIAKNNQAYSYVILQKDGSICSIGEFKEYLKQLG